MPRCQGIKRDGGRCTVVVGPGQSHCYQHDPHRAEERRRNASRGGRSGGRGRPSVELARLQARFKELADKVVGGEIERSVGAVVGQLLNGARACVRDGLAAREQEVLVGRLEELEETVQRRKDNGRWGA